MNVELKEVSIPKILEYTEIETPFGHCFVAHQEDLVFGTCFGKANDTSLFSSVFSGVKIEKSSTNPEYFREQMFPRGTISIRIAVAGTAFQVNVWRQLLEISYGSTTTYASISQRMNKATAHRAVANAIGANRVCWFIPCHRVIRSDGKFGGYRWGIEIKRKMLEYEKANSPVE